MTNQAAWGRHSGVDPIWTKGQFDKKTVTIPTNL